MLEDFLSKLGAGTKITVGVSISPGIGLEMIEVDRSTDIVNRYAIKPLDYNYSTREISDYDQFQTSLEELFDELRIPTKTNIILNIPNTHFGMINLPLLLTDEAITNAIISEVEQSYIFKRQEPTVSWAEVCSNIDTESRTLIYTAVQKTAMDKINEACKNVGCTIIGVENSYISLLRALHYTKLAKDQMKENINWNLMIVGQNSYSILSIVDKKIVEYYEEPLALKSFVDNEIYNAITTSAKLTLASTPARYLYIVSETDLVSAEVLSIKMEVESTVLFLESNKYIQNELMPVNLNILPKTALQITPEAIGTAVSQFSDFPIKLNLLGNENGGLEIADKDLRYPKVNIGNLEVELTPSFIKRIAIIAGCILILPMIFLSLLLGGVIIPKEQAKLDGINAQIEQTNAEIQKYKDANKNNTFNLSTFIIGVETTNKIKLLYYSALGISIPNKLWISYYMTDEAGKIDIKGKSTNVESIYAFYKNIKELVNNSDIRLYRLEFATESIDDVIQNISTMPKSYNFEITNMPEGELGAATPSAPQPTTTGGAPTQGSTPAPAPQNATFKFGKMTVTSAPAAPTPVASPSQPSTGGAKSDSGGSPTPASKPTQVAPNPTAKGDKLPDNLQKIEKF